MTLSKDWNDKITKVRALKDPRLFAKRYLDMDLYKFEEELAIIGLNHKRGKLYIEAPTDHGKSTVFGFLLPLMWICKDPNETILFGTSSPKLKKRTCIRNRDTLKNNAKLNEDFGPFYDRSNTWETTQFEVIRPDPILRDPTFTAVTTGEHIEGVKATKGILDDPIDIREQESETIRESDLTWYNTTWNNRIAPGAPEYYVFTRWHPMDLANTIKERGGIVHKEYIAINDAWDPETVLAPERWSVDLLRARARDIGSITFEQKFRNNPSAIVGVRLSTEWLNYYTTQPQIIKKVMLIDPAGGRKGSKSYYARMVMGLGGTEGKYKLYILDTFRAHLKFPEQHKDVAEADHVWNPERTVIESNFDGGALYEHLKDKYITIPLREHIEKRNKITKLEAMGAYFEDKTVWCLENMHDFIHEFVNFPGARNDLLDCCNMGIDYFKDYLFKKGDMPLPVLR